MPVTASDIIAYASANMPEDDTTTSGGAIDAKTRVVFTDIAATDDVEAVSTSASDTQNITVKGRLASGAIASQTIAMTGITPVNLSTNAFERILSVALASDAIGVVTVRRDTDDTTIGTIPVGERGFRRLFINAASDPSVGKDRFEKIFIKNTHATLALLSASINQSADPEADVMHALAASKDDTGSVANRLTDPGLTFNDTDKNVPGTDLAAGEAIGVWLKQTLAAAAAPYKSSYTVQAAGSTV